MEHTELKEFLSKHIQKLNQIRLEEDINEISLIFTNKGNFLDKYIELPNDTYLLKKHSKIFKKIIKKIIDYTSMLNYFSDGVNYLTVWEKGYSFTVEDLNSSIIDKDLYIFTVCYGMDYIVDHIDEIIEYRYQNEDTTGMTKEDLINLLKWDYDKYKMITELKK